MFEVVVRRTKRLEIEQEISIYFYLIIILFKFKIIQKKEIKYIFQNCCARRTKSLSWQLEGSNDEIQARILTIYLIEI